MGLNAKKALFSAFFNLIGNVVGDVCDPAGTRTQGPYIKSVLLYQLSYEIKPLSLFVRSAKVGVQFLFSKKKRKKFRKKFHRTLQADKKIIS
jgi:hypothetical protein